MEKSKSTRVGYKKSRKGCIRCKRRRVKCNEEAPCSACVRHGVPCSLDLNAATPTSDGTVTTPAIERTLSQFHEAETTSASPASHDRLDLRSSFLSSSLFSSPLDQPDCWVTNAELMLHYTVITHRTFVYSDNIAKVFQYDLPREALSHPYCLRIILATAAFHLAYLTPEKRQSYLLQASRHENLAFRGVREVLSKSVNSANCHALYGTTIFIVVCKFAAFPSCEDHQLHGCAAPIQALLDIFSLANGIAAIIRTPEGGAIRTGPLKELFARTPFNHAPSTLLQELVEHLPSVHRRIEGEFLDPKVKQVLLSTMESLIRSMELGINAPKLSVPTELRALFWWPILVPDEFVELAASSHPLALAIIAHYSVLLCWGGSRFWFFEGWAKALVHAVVDKVRGSPWEDLLDWPLRTIERGE